MTAQTTRLIQSAGVKGGTIKMGLLSRSSPRKRRESEILHWLADLAAKEAATEDFLAASAFVRAYGVALGITVPEHVTRILFSDQKYFESAWNCDFPTILDLASYISWAQAMAAFADTDVIAENEQSDRVAVRQLLMTVTGNVFPASDRAVAVIQNYQELMNDDNRQGDLREQGFLIPQENPDMGAHFIAIAEILGFPWTPDDVEPATAVAAQFFLAKLGIEATQYFRRRALEIFRAHVEHDVRAF